MAMSWPDIVLTVVLLVALWGAVCLIARRNGLDWHRNMFGQTRPGRKR